MDNKEDLEIPRYMPLTELKDKGYIQEVNRMFFHPLGLSLTITSKGCVWGLTVVDYTDDLEGVCFPSTMVDSEDFKGKVQYVRDELKKRVPARISALGYVTQKPSTPSSEEYPTEWVLDVVDNLESAL